MLYYLLVPFPALGLIIIDEEHTDSYKQDGANPKYHALDIAKWRSKYGNFPVVLGSATPTLESYARGEKKVYTLITLDKRVNGQTLPDTIIVDMKD